MEETMTVTQTLETTARNLQNIRVPAGLTQEISIPILQAIGNILACIETFKANEKAQAAGADVQENAGQLFPDGKTEENEYVDDQAE